MPEERKISTLTSFSTNGSDISILTEYNDIETLPFLKKVEIKGNDGIESAIPFTEGELIATLVNYPLEINCYLDSDGNFYVDSNSGDVNKYSIDSDGNLIYTE